MSFEKASVHHSRDLNARNPSVNHSHSRSFITQKAKAPLVPDTGPGAEKNFNFEDTSCSRKSYVVGNVVTCLNPSVLNQGEQRSACDYGHEGRVFCLEGLLGLGLPQLFKTRNYIRLLRA